MTDPKQDFYSFGDKYYNKLIELTPLPLLKWWHRKLYDHDDLIHKLEKYLEPVSDKYYDITRPIKDIYWKIRALPRRLNRVKDYTSFAWDTNDYCYTSLFRLLEFKLARMESAIRQGHHLNSGDCAEQIRLVRELFNFLSSEKTDEINPWPTSDETWSKYLGLDRDSNREVTLTEGGAKMVMYVCESRHTEIREEEHARIRGVYEYKNDLQVAIFRVICHIMTPAFGPHKVLVNGHNKRVREELGIEWQDYHEHPDKFKYDHGGFYGWWE